MTAPENGPVEVVIYHLTDDPKALLSAYQDSRRRMQGTVGLVAEELRRRLDDDRVWTVSSRWASLSDFQVWEGSPGHPGQTAALRPFRDLTRARPFEVFQVVDPVQSP